MSLFVTELNHCKGKFLSYQCEKMVLYVSLFERNFTVDVLSLLNSRILKCNSNTVEAPW